MALINIEIKSWADYQGRKDVKNPSWFKLSHFFLEHPKIADLSSEEKIAWIYILCERSKRRTSDVVTINGMSFHRVTGISEECFHRAISKLKQLQMIEVRTLRGRYARGTLDQEKRREPSACAPGSRKEERAVPAPEDTRNVLESAVTPSATPAEPSSSSKFIGVYVESYQRRYGQKARPGLGGKTQGGIKRLLGETPLARACEMIQVFLQMDDPWFVTKAHDFETFTANLTKVGLALDTGVNGGVSKWEQEMLQRERDDFSRISEADGPNQKHLRGPDLPTGANQGSLE